MKQHGVTCTSQHTYIHIYTYTCTHMHTRMHTHTHTHTPMPCKCTRARAYALLTSACKLMHNNTYMISAVFLGPINVHTVLVRPCARSSVSARSRTVTHFNFFPLLLSSATLKRIKSDISKTTIEYSSE